MHYPDMHYPDWAYVDAFSLSRHLVTAGEAVKDKMKRTWTIIGVADVPQSFKWYQSLLGLPETAPAHEDFGQIIDSDGTVLLCLHEWGAHEHPSLKSPVRQAWPRPPLVLPS